jgi:hypothetical protein
VDTHTDPHASGPVHRPGPDSPTGSSRGRALPTDGPWSP